MAETGGNWSLWQWALGVIGSALGGSMVIGWVGRGVIDSIKAEAAAQKLRLDKIETEQGKCQSGLKIEIKDLVQQALDRQALAHYEQLGAIRTELAVITALYGETQADVKSIFDRLERRKSEVTLPPYGERRDQ